jgi:aryl carrier-like protein
MAYIISLVLADIQVVFGDLSQNCTLGEWIKTVNFESESTKDR